MKAIFSYLLLSVLIISGISPAYSQKSTQKVQDLFLAVRENKIEKVKRILQSGTAINSHDIFDRTPLHIAALYGRIKIARLLLSGVYYQGELIQAKVNHEDGYGLTPLHYAVAGQSPQHIQLVELLILNGAQVNAQRNEGGAKIHGQRFIKNITPLHIASKLGNYKAVQTLLNATEVEINAKDFYGLTPLHYAVSSKNGRQVKVLQLLLKHKAKINARSTRRLGPYHKGSTPLKVALYYLADLMMQEISEHVISKTLNYLKPTVLSNRKIYQFIMNYLRSNNELNTENFLKLFRQELKKNKELVMIYLADNHGNLTMAKRMPDKTISNRFVKSTKKGIQVRYQHENPEYTKSFPNTLDDFNSGYDPRKRIWFKKAESQKKMVWTDVYTFATDKKPGLSNAIPIYQNNKLLGVTSIDVGVIELSYFLSKLVVGKRGKSFILGHYQKNKKETKVIALPIGSEYEIEQLFEKNKKTDQYQLVPVSRIWQKDIVASYQNFYKLFGTHFNKTVQFSFLHQGEPYLAMYIPFPKSSGLNWTIGILIPENEVIRSVEKHIALIKSKRQKEHIFQLSKMIDILRKNGAKSLDLNDDLFLAVKLGNYQKVKQTLLLGANSNASDKNGWKPLHYCAYYGGKAMESIAKLLLMQRKVDFYARTNSMYLGIPQGKTTFEIAKKFNHKLILKLLLSARVQSNNKLIQAVESGKLNKVKRALMRGASVNAVKNKKSVLVLAIIKGYNEIASYLLKMGASPNRRDQNGWNALHFAARYERYQIADKLLKMGVQINSRTYKKYQNILGGSTPLKIVEQFYDSALVPLLKKNGGKSIDANNTLIMGAVQDNFPLIKKALKQGANIDYRSSFGWTALHILAAKSKKLQIFHYLIQNDANTNTKTFQKRFGVGAGKTVKEIILLKKTGALQKAFLKLVK